MINSKKDRELMTFGKMPIANNFISKSDFNNEFFYEMKVGFNDDYSLFKLLEHPKPEQMFNSDYPFLTGSSKYMVKHFQSFSEMIKKNYLDNQNNKVIEIGCNDGSMLSFFDNQENLLGFEPSSNVADIAKSKNLNIISDFFSSKYDVCKKFLRNTKVIYAANVICHIPDLNSLIEDLDKFLLKNGVFIFEEPYLGSMVAKTSYDQIYDEHVYIFSVSSIKKLFKVFDFDLVDVIPQKTHGGSMRYVVARKGQYSIKDSVKIYEKKEGDENLDNFDGLLNFKKNCVISKEKTISQLTSFKKKGFKICGYAATSKSTTVLNYCNIDTKIIDCIYDTTPDKIGRYTPGTHIPIIDHSEFKNSNFDVVYLFAWNHKEEIFNKEKNFIRNGGRWFSHVEF